MQGDILIDGEKNNRLVFAPVITDIVYIQNLFNTTLFFFNNGHVFI